MNPSISTAHARIVTKSKLFVTAALALAGTLSTGAALARGDVQWSVTVGAPVYVQPVPVYRHYPQHSGRYDPYYRPYHYPRHYRQPTHWDHDGDGIPNRRDPVYNPRWDVDGDGIPNRHDRDRDGIPDWHDRNDSRYWRGR